jgi:hypothetical protein
MFRCFEIWDDRAARDARRCCDFLLRAEPAIDVQYRAGDE